MTSEGSGRTAVRYADAAVIGEELENRLGERRSLLLLMDKASLLRSITEAAKDVGGLDVSMIGDPDGRDAIILRGHVGIEHDSLRDLSIPMGIGLGGKVFALRRPAWVPDYVSSNAITHDFDLPVREERLRGMVGLPMTADGDCVGVLYAALRRRAHFGDDVIGALQRVADHGAEQISVANRLEERTASAVAAERSRIATGLHDSVGAMLFNTGAELRALRSDATSPSLINRLREIERQVAKTASLFRESLAALDDTEPQIQLAATLVEDCGAFEKRTGVHARCVALTALPTLPAEYTGALVSVAREALLNVEKHARATSVVVSLAAIGSGLMLVVADDGIGWDPEAEVHPSAETPPWSSGIGLRAARERLERIGGMLSAVGNEDGGLTVRAHLPTP
jgi:signal transduction histidine kinase